MSEREKEREREVERKWKEIKRRKKSVKWWVLKYSLTLIEGNANGNKYYILIWNGTHSYGGYSIVYTLYIAHNTLHIMHEYYTLYTVDYTLCNIHCIVYTVSTIHYAHCTVHCTFSRYTL